MTEKLRQIDKSKARGPDNLPAWLLKTYADILAPAITDVLNSSFLEGKVPSTWKIANIAPLPKAQDMEDFNKDLRPIALASTLSKFAEEYIIQNELKPTVRVILLDYNYSIKPTVLNWIVVFLRNRYQRVKIDSNCFSDFLHVPAGVPQGTNKNIGTGF